MSPATEATQARHDSPSSRVTRAALGLLMAGALSACGGGPSLPHWARVCGRHCAGAPVQVELGNFHTCLRYAGGAMVCWGNVRGSMEDVEMPELSDPLPDDPLLSSDARRATRLVPGMLDVKGMACDTAACCALRATGEVWCWGQEGHFGRMKAGIYWARADPRIPELVPGLESVQHFIPNDRRMVVLNHDDRVFRVGPAAIVDIGDAMQPAPPTQLSECELSEGHVYCEGYNYVGQRGLGYITRGSGSPDPNLDLDVAVIGIDDAIAIAGSGVARCALRASGEVWCWGGSRIIGYQDPAYVPGRGSPPEPTPKPVEGLDHIVDLQAGKEFFCVLREDHQLLCWGEDSAGVLHTPGHEGERWEPYAVPDARGVVSMDIRGTRICVIRESGEVACNDGFPPEVSEPEGWQYGDLVTLPNLPDLAADFADEPTEVPEEPFDFDAAGPPGDPHIIFSRR